MIAHGIGILRLGDISLDGTKIKANASKHKAMSWEYANKLEAQFKAETDELLKKAEAESGKSGGIDIPAELERREARLEKIAEVKAEIERRAQERYEQEKAAYEAKLKEREEKEKNRGRKLGGKKPTPPEPRGDSKYKNILLFMKLEVIGHFHAGAKKAKTKPILHLHAYGCLWLHFRLLLSIMKLFFPPFH